MAGIPSPENLTTKSDVCAPLPNLVFSSNILELDGSKTTSYAETILCLGSNPKETFVQNRCDNTTFYANPFPPRVFLGVAALIGSLSYNMFTYIKKSNKVTNPFSAGDPYCKKTLTVTGSRGDETRPNNLYHESLFSSSGSIGTIL